MTNIESTQSEESQSALGDASQFDVEAVVEAVLTKGLPLYEVRGLTTEHLEALYAIAYSRYQADLYEEAEKIFLVLCVYDHMSARYWLAAGATQVQLKKYKEAIFSFASCCALDPENPTPFYYFANCQVAVGDQRTAAEAYDLAILLSGDKPQYQDIGNDSKARRALIGPDPTSGAAQ